MKKIYNNSGLLCHLVYKFSDFTEARTELIDPDNFIQCSALLLQEGHTFKPHKHISKSGPSIVVAQESWCVIKGSVRVSFFDHFGNLLDESILRVGDTSFTLSGGHTYTILEDNTFVYEYKTGPYKGQELDKEFFNV